MHEDARLDEVFLMGSALQMEVLLLCEHCPHPIHWLSAAGQERDLVLQRIGAQALELDITMSMSTGKAPTFGEMVAMVHDLLKDGETEKAAAYLVLASRKALR
jgi:hypothetical protein